MKRMLKISLLFYMVSLIACNGNEKNSDPETAISDTLPSKDSLAKKPLRKTNKTYLIEEECSGVYNLTIGEKEADTMKKNYETIYVNTLGADLVTSVWLDANVIRAFANHLTGTFDGVRFINGAKAQTGTTTLILVPTKKSSTTPSKHINNWGNVSLQNGEAVTFQDFNLGNDSTLGMKDRFKNRFLTREDDENYCLSTSIWMGKCIFFALRDIIDNPDYEVDGVRVWFGAYSDLRYQTTLQGQKTNKQSTLILVPTHANGNEHIDDWNIIKGTEKWNKGYNHGQLCPQICD